MSSSRARFSLRINVETIINGLETISADEGGLTSAHKLSPIRMVHMVIEDFPSMC